MKRTIKQLLVCILSVCLLAGCSSKNTGVTTKDPENSAPLVMGTESESALKLQVNNETGSAIKSFAIKEQSESVYSDNLLPTSVYFEQGQSAILYFEPTVEITEDTDFDVRIVLQDNSVFELATFPIQDMKESVTLHLSKSVVFIKYVSNTTGKQVSTLDLEVAEKARRDELERKRKAEEEKKKKVEEEMKKSEAEEKESSSQPSDDSSDTTNTPSTPSTPPVEPEESETPVEPIQDEQPTGESEVPETVIETVPQISSEE